MNAEQRMPTLAPRTQFETYDIRCAPCVKGGSKSRACSFAVRNPNLVGPAPASPAVEASSSSSPTVKPSSSVKHGLESPSGSVPKKKRTRSAREESEDVKPKVAKEKAKGKEKEKERVPVADIVGLSDMPLPAFSDWADIVDPTSGERKGDFDFDGEKAKLVKAIRDSRPKPLFRAESTTPDFVEPVFERSKRKELSPSEGEEDEAKKSEGKGSEEEE
ncbi:DNA mismatch repair protein msh6 [Pseudohyphozyma bogoriensis]|nr:DNA mismatch repair protein msh6 [Pseudohyphozyma bogoriensis]